jgi:hypothetical protein
MRQVRTSVTLSARLLADVDDLAGPRGRSRYIADAVTRRVKRDRLGLAIEAAWGSLVPRDGRPLTRAEVSALVAEMRSEVSD